MVGGTGKVGSKEKRIAKTGLIHYSFRDGTFNIVKQKDGMIRIWRRQHMKCTSCGMPLSPYRATTQCPRCGAPVTAGNNQRATANVGQGPSLGGNGGTPFQAPPQAPYQPQGSRRPLYADPVVEANRTPAPQPGQVWLPRPDTPSGTNSYD